MNSIGEIIGTTEFWFVAVFVGLFINIMATFFIHLIKHSFSHLNKKWDARSEKSKLKREKAVEKYSTSYQQLYLGKLEQNHKKLTAIHEFIIASVLLLFGMAAKPSLEFVSTIAGFGALLAVFGGLMASIAHGRFMLLIADAEHRLIQRQLDNGGAGS